MTQRIYHIVYALMVFIVVAMIGWAFIQYNGTSQVDYCFDEPIDFSAGWTLDNGIEINTAKLCDIENIGTYEEFGIHNKLPENITEGQYLCFRSKNIFFSVYFDDELVYEPYVEESMVYCDSYGTGVVLSFDADFNTFDFVFGCGIWICQERLCHVCDNLLCGYFFDHYCSAFYKDS